MGAQRNPKGLRQHEKILLRSYCDILDFLDLSSSKILTEVDILVPESRTGAACFCGCISVCLCQRDLKLVGAESVERGRTKLCIIF